MFTQEETALAGVIRLRPIVRSDTRGAFVKAFQNSYFTKLGFETDFREIYYSWSHTNVLRGLHFQTPPADGAKMVACATGLVHDVLLDLRTQSKTYGQHVILPLNGESGDMVYMPAGVAHGFWVERGPALMVYFQKAEYAPDQDKGVLWNDSNIAWPCQDPLISDRDKTFPPLASFSSPF